MCECSKADSLAGGRVLATTERPLWLLTLNRVESTSRHAQSPRYAVTTYGLAPTQPPCSAAARYMRIILPAADRHSHDNVTLWRFMSPDGGSLIQRRLRRHGVGESCLVVRLHDPPWSV